MEDVFDAIVVGSGASGSIAAHTFATAGLRVLLLEAGPIVPPVTDLQPPQTSHKLKSVSDRILGAISGQPVQIYTSTYNSNISHFFVNDRRNPYTTTRGRPFRWIRGRQVGGRLHTWSRLSLRFSNYEFHAASIDGKGDNWPLTLAELTPFYTKVESLLGVDGNIDNLPQIPDGHYREAWPLTAAEIDFREKIERRWPSNNVVGARVMHQLTESLPSVLSEPAVSEHLTLRPDSVASHVIVNPTSGKATGIEYINRATGQRLQAKGRIVMLCASAFETVRVLLNSTSERFPDGIGASSGNLGHYIMDHPFYHTNGRFSDTTKANNDFVIAPYDFASSNGFYIPRHLNEEIGGSTSGRGYGITGCIGRGGNWWWMGAFAEMLAVKHNRLSLHPKKNDAWGIPVANIDITLSDEDRRLIYSARQHIHDMAEEAGLVYHPPRKRISFTDLLGSVSLRDYRILQPGLSIHELGGARMGRDPIRSVLDPNGRCWDCRNVIVGDGSCFPSSGYQNPALTIMALAARAAELAVRDFNELTI